MSIADDMRIEADAYISPDHRWQRTEGLLRNGAERIAELEALLREIDAKVVFESAVMDGTGSDLQDRVERALRIKA